MPKNCPLKSPYVIPRENALNDEVVPYFFLKFQISSKLNAITLKI